jgi:hypothetical protein
MNSNKQKGQKNKINDEKAINKNPSFNNHGNKSKSGIKYEGEPKNLETSGHHSNIEKTKGAQNVKTQKASK